MSIDIDSLGLETYEDLRKKSSGIDAAHDPIKSQKEYSSSANPAKFLPSQDHAEIQKQEKMDNFIEISFGFFAFVLFVFIIRRAKNRLDTARKRAFSVIAIIGSALLLYGIFSYGYSNSAISNAFEFDGVKDQPAIFFGFWSAVFGYCMSWFYDISVGKIVAWVKTGKAPSIPALWEEKTDRTVKELEPGVRGWLFLLVFLMTVIWPLLSGLGTLGNHMIAMPQYDYERVEAFLKLVVYTKSILLLVAGLGLALGRLPSYVDLAKFVVILVFPVFSAIIFFGVPYILIGRFQFSPDVISGMIGQILFAGIIVTYLSLSKRVKATYCRSAAKQQEENR